MLAAYTFATAACNPATATPLLVQRLTRHACVMQGILADQALRLLADSTWTSLDISFSTVSDACMQNVIKSLPNLLTLDITGCKFHPRTLQLLGQHCPQLQVLRLGMCQYHRPDSIRKKPRATEMGCACRYTACHAVQGMLVYLLMILFHQPSKA